MHYTLSVHNNGPDSAQNVQVEDRLPQGTSYTGSTGLSCTASGQDVTCTAATLASAGTATATIDVNVDPAALPGTVIGNGASVFSWTTGDPNYVDNTAATTTNIPPAAPLSGFANLSLVVTDSPDPVSPGATLTYTLTVHNGGPDTAQNVRLEDSLPPGTVFVGVTVSGGLGCVLFDRALTCTASSILAGADATATVTVTVDPGVPAGTVLADVGAVFSTNTRDGTTGNNTFASATRVVAPPTAVEIAGLAAHRAHGGVVLHWRAFSGAFAGFDVFRGAGAVRTRLNRHLIAALPRRADYEYVEYVDRRSANKPLVYFLRVRRLDASTFWVGPVRVE